MHSFDELINQLAWSEPSEGSVVFNIQVEIGPEIAAIVAARFYDSDEEVGRAVKAILQDCVNDHIFYEVNQ